MMEEGDGEEEEEAGMEIVSLGALHRGGDWEKKYWSCSRGKDRYPYPVGYQAVRHHSGVSYMMEIRGGPKGPLFVVTSTDGDSSTGQTPDIAWKNFQKKAGSKVKNLQGRNFSCKIDGIELFGFRNAAVQRLLRELLVDSNGAIEKILPCPITSNAAAQFVYKVETNVSDAHEDLPVCLDNTCSTGKRSMKLSQEEGSAKRVHVQDLVPSVDICNGDLDNSAHKAPIEGDPGSRKELLDVNNSCTSKCIPRILKCTPDANLGELGPVSSQQVELSSGSSYASSEKCDLESAEQEVAKAMMAFLLPQAIPLLKKTYRRRKLKQKNKVEISESTNSRRGASVGKSSAHGVVAPTRLGKGTEDDSFQTVVQVKPLCEMVTDNCTNDACMDDATVSILEEVKTVVADSFQDDDQMWDDNVPKPMCVSCHESDDACSSEPKQNCSNLLCSKKEEHAEPSECRLGMCEGTGEGDVSKNREKVEYVLSDSLLACLEEEFGEKDSSCPDHSNQGNTGVEHIQVLHHFAMHDSVQQFNDLMDGGNNGSTTMDISKHNNLSKSEACIQIETHDRKILSNGECLTNNREQSHGLGASSRNDLSVPLLKDPVHANARNDTEKRVTHVSSRLMATTTTDAKSTLLVMPNEALPIELSSHREHKLHSANYSSREYDIPLSESTICRDFADGEFVDKFVAFESAKKGNHCITRSGIENIDAVWSLDNGMKAGKSDHPNKGEQCQPGGRNGNKNIMISVGCEKNIVPPMDNLDIIYPPKPVILASTSTSQDTARSATCNMKSDLSFSHFKGNYTSRPQEAPTFCIMQPKEKRHIALQKGNEIPKAFPHSNGNPIADSELGYYYEEKYHGHTLSHINHLNGLPSEHRETSAGEPYSDLKLMGCYLHPMPVLSIMLNTKGSTLQIYVLCGFLESCERSLYIYNVTPEEQEGTPPHFIGYTPLLLPSLEQSSKGNFPFGRSGLQFTPDGQFLVLRGSIKTPFCRTQSIYCSCSLCKLDHCGDNALKIVSVNFGYVSLLTKLMSSGKVSCTLICEPNCIIAVEDRGNLHIWVMNDGWRVISEEYMVSRFGYVGPSILELRRIPKRSSLIIGHNGIGGFCLWDISTRTLLATFTAPGNIVFQILPLGFCSLQKDIIHSSLDGIEKNLQEMTMNDIPGKTVRESFLMLPGEDIAIWLLVSAASIAEFQHDLRAKEPNTRWRLALLANKTVFMGNILDPRASAIDASGSYGFAGTYGGLLYRWELSSGIKFAGTQCFKCGRVSCIAVDAKSSVVAVADDECQLLLYKQNKKPVD